MKNQIIQKISKEKFNNYSDNNKCSCCKCVTSFCYCLCQCKCHKEKIVPKIKRKNYDTITDVNIDELKMKSLNEYTSSSILKNTKNTLSSSRNMMKMKNLKMDNFNSINSYFNKNLKNLDDSSLNKSQDLQYMGDYNILDKKINRKKYRNRIKKNHLSSMNHYKTQSNFIINDIQKYYQLNNNDNKYLDNNKTLKSQVELNKLLSNIKKDKKEFKNKKFDIPRIAYNDYIKRENSFYSRKNNSEIDSNNITKNSDYFNNEEKKEITNDNFKEEKYGQFLNNDSIDFGFYTQYNKPFKPLNPDNKNFNLDKEYRDFKFDDNILEHDKYDTFSKTYYKSDLNSNKGGNTEYNKLNDGSELTNYKEIKNIGNDNFLSKFEINKNIKYSSNNTNDNKTPEINQNKKFDIKNIKNKSKINNINKIIYNRNEFQDLKDINSDNLFLTFGAKGNNEINNLKKSLQNEMKLQKNKENGKDQDELNNTINNIMNDYENLKKKYSSNRLFTGLLNNINDLNNQINIVKEIPNKNNISNYSKTFFDFTIKGELNKNNNEINNLKIELKDAKNKIKELTKIIINYQREINSLKGQIINQKSESIDISKINTINNISSSNNNSNKTKIGKNSFIIKIPQSLIKRRIKKDNNSNHSNKSNSFIDMTNSFLNNQEYNGNNTLLDLTNTTYKRVLLKNNSNNFNNISKISNNTNSNYLTNNNNISCSNISRCKLNNDIYTKKITTTMQKTFRKSASQKLRVNKINNNENIYSKTLEVKRISKFLFKIIFQNDNIALLGFDIINHEFNIINFIDCDNFELDFKENFYNNKEDDNSIYLNNEKNNNFYIVTGKNCNHLYKYNYEANKMKKLCTFKNDHSNGCLLLINNNVICLSGNHNKKVEIFSEQNNSLINLPEMNIERSCFSCCLIRNEFIFALFGYNYPRQKYLNTIEYYELGDLENLNYNYIDSKSDRWKYLNYKDNNSLNLCIKGHLCFNYFDEQIIFFGGFNGYKNKAVDCFYKLNLSDNFYLEKNNEYCYLESVGKKLNDFNKNRIYYFGNNNGFLFNYNQNNMFFAAIDNNYYAHILELNNFKHNIHYLN